MAACIDMFQMCTDYARGGWKWGERDCIGLMFELLTWSTGEDISRYDYMPEGLTYNEAVDWLVNKNEYVLYPYLQLLDQDLKVARAQPGEDGHLIILSKGPPLITSTGDQYPIDPIPGIAFKCPNKLPLVFGGKGLVNAHIPEDTIDWVIRYELDGVR